MPHRTLISEPLLVCARTTIGMGIKQLLVSGVNHYRIAPETTTGMRANNYCFTFTPHCFTLKSNLYWSAG